MGLQKHQRRNEKSSQGNKRHEAHPPGYVRWKDMISGRGGQPLGGAYSTPYSPDKVMAKKELAETSPTVFQALS